MLAVDVVADGGLAAAMAGLSRRDRAGIEVLELELSDIIDEYVRRYLRSPIPPSRVGPFAAILDYVAVAAPGVREVLTIGKIAEEVRSGPHDVVVVDAPATGHVVELLAAPQTLRQTITVGPLADQTAWIASLLADRETTGVVVVTGTDGIVVDETDELIARLGDEVEVGLAAVVANRVADRLSPAAVAEAQHLASGGTDAVMSAAAALVAGRSALADDGVDRLASLIADWAPVADVPLVVIGDRPDPVLAVADALGAEAP